MLLTPEEAELFFELHRNLMFFVNQRLHVLPDKIGTPEEFAGVSLEARLEVREAFLDETDLIDSFVNENPGGFSDDELDIVLSWRHLVAGNFCIFRELKQHTVFLSSEDQPIAYGVTALTQPFEQLVGPYLPVMTEAVLLPFKNKIVYDGLLAGLPVSLSFGPGIRRMLKIRQFDHEWTLPSRMDKNPLIWMLTVNGFVMDIRQAPREAQVVAFEKGLIPYIPADRGKDEE